MRLPVAAARSNYNNAIEGTIGRFVTPAGTVMFLQTRAKLSHAGTSNACRLTSLLTPAREALDVQAMDFNQLLQRDLDDHRIAHELVPYILTPRPSGPAFFPPILAALLPFSDRRPISELPPLVEAENAVDPLYENTHWHKYTCEDFFSVQELLDINGSPDPLGLALLRWNDERAKLIIMDGQHRAMALLAIYRTMTNTWSTGLAAERYRPFYESKIQSLLGASAQNRQLADIEALEFPVSICIFPEFTGPDKDPHKAARKLFVDVNKEAKLPSESRLILLSDVRLDNVLARELLNRLRANGSSSVLPLFAIEYDNPHPRSTTPRRWSALTNLDVLLKIVRFCCFGPKDVVCKADQLARVIGKRSMSDMNLYFREEMRLNDIMAASIEDGPRTLQRLDIGLESFPIYNREARDALLDRFYVLWGQGILRLLSEVAPYRAHIEALTAVKNSWSSTADATSSLAHEALFEGVGLFWTLEQGHLHWAEECQRLRDNKPAQTDVSRAWLLLAETKRREFEEERARIYCGHKDIEHVAECNAFYASAITHAAQVGLVLTWALIRSQNQSKSHDTILNAMITCINRSLTTGPVASRSRRLILSKSASRPLNVLPKLDAPFASYFRVFWLELLLDTANASDLESAGINLDSARGALATGRMFYVRRMITDRAEALKRTHPTWTTSKRAKKSTETAIQAFADAHHWWFGTDKSEMASELTQLFNSEEDAEIDDFSPAIIEGVLEESEEDGDSNDIE